MLCGAFLLVTFGWAVAVNTLIGVFLQTPVELGGYGFSPSQNAECQYRSLILAHFSFANEPVQSTLPVGSALRLLNYTAISLPIASRFSSVIALETTSGNRNTAYMLSGFQA
jgi:hypothetical protein